MIVQINEITNVNEAIRICGIGADLIGVTVGEGKLPGEVRPYRAKEIFLSLPKDKKGVLRIHSSNIREIEKIIKDVEPDIVHLLASVNDLVPQQVDLFRKEFPKLQFMRTIPVVGEESVVASFMFDSLYDYIVLDTKDVKSGMVGSTGKTHNWDISRKVVETISIPVILSGGLNSENVQEAIEKVKPYGVMSHTKTDKIGKSEKDLIKVKMFVDKAKSVKIEAA